MIPGLFNETVAAVEACKDLDCVRAKESEAERRSTNLKSALDDTIDKIQPPRLSFRQNTVALLYKANKNIKSAEETGLKKMKRC